MAKLPELPKDCWDLDVATSEQIRVGDVFAPVPFLRLDDTFAPFETGGEFTLSVGMVVNTAVYCIAAPVTTPIDVTEQVLQTAVRDAARFPFLLRLPTLPDFWVGTAVVQLFHPFVLPPHLLEQPPYERVAAMTDTARKILKKRYGAAAEF